MNSRDDQARRFIKSPVRWFFAGAAVLFVLVALGRAKEGPATVVVCNDTQDPRTMDPFLELTEKNHVLLQQMMEGLVRFDPEGKVIPCLAESWEQVDPLRLRFHLRKDVEFHNGEPFNAEVVRFSAQTFSDPNGVYPGKGFVSSIDRVEVVDPSTVDIVTRFSDGILLRRFAGLIFMVPPDYYKRVGSRGFSERPVGTGPFKFLRHVPGREIVLAANKRYWRVGWPKFDQLIFRFIAMEGQVQALIDGKTDVLTDLPGTMTLRVMENPSTQVIKKESMYTVTGHFNTSKGILADVRVRRAIDHAINVKELIRYDLLANGVPMASLSFPGQVGYDPSLTPYKFDVPKAKHLLKEAGVQTPVRLTMVTVPFGERTAKIIAKQLEVIGLKVDLSVYPDAEIFQAFQNHTWDIGVAVLPSPIAHIAFPLTLMFFSQSPYSLHKSPEFDRMFLDAVTALDPAEQEKKFCALVRYVHDEALGIFTYQRIKTYGVNRRVHFVPSVTGMAHFVDTTLEEAPSIGSK